MCLDRCASLRVYDVWYGMLYNSINSTTDQHYRTNDWRGYCVHPFSFKTCQKRFTIIFSVNRVFAASNFSPSLTTYDKKTNSIQMNFFQFAFCFGKHAKVPYCFL